MAGATRSWAVAVACAIGAGGLASEGVHTTARATRDAPSVPSTVAIDPTTAAGARGGEAWHDPPPLAPRGAETRYGPAAASTASSGCRSRAMAAPSHLYIPSLCVDVELNAAGEANGAMAVPADPNRVGWLTSAAPLGAIHGTTVLAGHVNSGGRRGTLWHLTAITPRALVVTTDSEGNDTRWRVYAVEQVPKQPVPLIRSGRRELIVASCAGAVIRTASGSHYADNVLVHAVPESDAEPL